MKGKTVEVTGPIELKTLLLWLLWKIPHLKLNLRHQRLSKTQLRLWLTWM